MPLRGVPKSGSRTKKYEKCSFKIENSFTNASLLFNFFVLLIEQYLFVINRIFQLLKKFLKKLLRPVTLLQKLEKATFLGIFGRGFYSGKSSFATGLASDPIHIDTKLLLLN